MKKKLSSQLGLSLTETLLVLAIIGAVLTISIRQYAMYTEQKELTQLRANVGVIMQGLGFYYRTECYGVTTDINANTINPGTLNPNQDPAPEDPFPVTIAALEAGGYLTARLKPIPLVNDANDPYTAGYIAQFNLQESARAQIGTSPAGTSVIWLSQVAVLINDNYLDKINQFVSILGATCRSELNGSVVTPCANAPAGEGNYIVWEQLPSSTFQGRNSPFWLMMPIVKMDTQLYTDYKLQNDPRFLTCGG